MHSSGHLSIGPARLGSFVISFDGSEYVADPGGKHVSPAATNMNQ